MERHEPESESALLVKLLKNNEVTEELILEYLSFIDAPITLNCLIGVADNLKKGYELLEKMSDPWKEEISILMRFMPVIEGIVEVGSDRRSRDDSSIPSWWWPKYFDERKHRKDLHPNRGQMGAHPFYTMLCNEQKEKTHFRDCYRLLQLQLTFARWYHLEQIKRVKPVRMAEIYRSMNPLSAASDLRELEFLDTSVPPAVYWEKLEGNRDQEYRYIAELHKTLRVLVGIEAQKTRTRQGGETRRFKGRLHARFNYSSFGRGEAEGDGDIERTMNLSLDDEAVDMALADDIHPGELSVADEVIFPDQREEKKGGASSNRRLGPHSSKRQWDKVARIYQNPPFRPEKLANAEMATILAGAEEWFNTYSREALEPVISEERFDSVAKPLQFVIHLMIQVWLGAKLDDIPAELRHSEGDIRLEEQGGVRCWVLRCPNLKSLLKLPDSWDHQRTLVKQFNLPDYYHIGDFYDRLNKITEKHGRKFAFTKWEKEKDYKAQLNKFTRYLKKRFSVRITITPAMLENFLPQQIQRVGGDLTLAAYLVGRSFNQVDVQLHYFSPKVAILGKVYDKVVAQVLKSIGENWPVEAEIAFKKGEPTIREDHQEGAVGVEHCPTKETVSRIWPGLRQAIKETDDIERIHNLFTAYTILIVGFTTGYRAVTDPTLPDSWFGPYGTLILSDKDGLRTREKVESFYNTRQVPVIDVLQRQLDIYRDYRPKLIKRLEEDQRCLPAQYKLAQKDAPHFFYLREGELIEARPRETERLVNQWYSLKLNSNRRYLRTELIERGVRPEYVDAFLSHWRHAQAFWEPLSSLSPIKMIAALRDALNELAKESGMRTLQSPIRARKNSRVA